MGTFGKRLIKAAKEARQIARGEADPASYRIHVPAEIDVAKVRGKLKLSQAQFAKRFGFNPASVKDWEQGRASPTGAISAYITVIAKDPKAVERALTAGNKARYS